MVLRVYGMLGTFCCIYFLMCHCCEVKFRRLHVMYADCSMWIMCFLTDVCHKSVLVHNCKKTLQFKNGVRSQITRVKTANVILWLSAGSIVMSSLLWHCWLGIRTNVGPVNNDWWGAGVVVWLEWGASDLHMVQLMPLPSHHLLLH